MNDKRVPVSQAHKTRPLDEHAHSGPVAIAAHAAVTHAATRRHTRTEHRR